jgi:hypothetical protein
MPANNFLYYPSPQPERRGGFWGPSGRSEGAAGALHPCFSLERHKSNSRGVRGSQGVVRFREISSHGVVATSLTNMAIDFSELAVTVVSDLLYMSQVKVQMLPSKYPFQASENFSINIH